jgi:hypothetical protein
MKAAVVSAYPNPFNASAILTVSGLDAQGKEASFKIYDTRGRLMEDLSQSLRGHRMLWNAGKHPSGIYFAILKSGKRVVKRKLVLLR